MEYSEEQILLWEKEEEQELEKAYKDYVEETYSREYFLWNYSPNDCL